MRPAGAGTFGRRNRVTSSAEIKRVFVTTVHAVHPVNESVRALPRQTGQVGLVPLCRVFHLTDNTTL